MSKAMSEPAENKLIVDMPTLDGEFFSPAISQETRNISLLFLFLWTLFLGWLGLTYGSTIFWPYVGVVFVLCVLIPIVITCFAATKPNYLLSQAGAYFKAKTAQSPSKTNYWLFVPWENLTNIRYKVMEQTAGNEAWVVFDLRASLEEVKLFFNGYISDNSQRAGAYVVRFVPGGWAGIHFDVVKNLNSWKNKHLSGAI
jgi:hypothetical protein